MFEKQDFVARPLEGRALYDSHVDHYRRALEQDFDQAYERYGFVFFHSLRASERINLANKLELLRGDASDQYNLATLAAGRGDYKQARERLEKALEMDPTHFESAYQLAAVFERLGDLDKAKLWGRKALELAPDDERSFVEEQLETIGSPAEESE